MRKKRVQRSRIGERRQVPAMLGRQCHDAIPVLGCAQHASNRWQPLVCSQRAATPLAATMTFSINSWARLLRSGTQVPQHLAVENSAGLDGLQGQGALRMAHASQRLCELILKPHLALKCGGFESGWRRRLPSSQLATLS